MELSDFGILEGALSDVVSAARSYVSGGDELFLLGFTSFPFRFMAIWFMF